MLSSHLAALFKHQHLASVTQEHDHHLSLLGTRNRVLGQHNPSSQMEPLLSLSIMGLPFGAILITLVIGSPQDYTWNLFNGGNECNTPIFTYIFFEPPGFFYHEFLVFLLLSVQTIAFINIISHL